MSQTFIQCGSDSNWYKEKKRRKGRLRTEREGPWSLWGTSLEMLSSTTIIYLLLEFKKISLGVFPEWGWEIASSTQSSLILR